MEYVSGDDLDGYERRCEEHRPEFVPGPGAFFKLGSLLDNLGIDTSIESDPPLSQDSRISVLPA